METNQPYCIAAPTWLASALEAHDDESLETEEQPTETPESNPLGFV